MGKGGEEDRDCDGRTVYIETWRVWERSGEREEKIEGNGDSIARTVRGKKTEMVDQY